ncbi:MAG: transposase [Verrucomicrobia bacterium]|nr:transposase [Verrucomicrobiota bacterium]
MPYPRRRQIPHVPPSFVRSGAVYFLTLCCGERERNQLASDAVWNVVREAARQYHDLGRWKVRLLLAMPDHVHALVSFPSTERGSRVVASWKHFISRRTGVRWQRDYFDHRLRGGESLDEKATYILQNPVRKGLCTYAGEWRFCWRPSDSVATPAG